MHTTGWGISQRKAERSAIRNRLERDGTRWEKMDETDGSEGLYLIFMRSVEFRDYIFVSSLGIYSFEI